MAITADTTRQQQYRRKTSAAHNTVKRGMTHPAADLSATPPGCRAVCFSSWTRFTSDSSKKPRVDMRASALCAGRALKADFNPPLLERVYLGVDQPLACGEPEEFRRERRRPQRRRMSSTSSWMTSTSNSTAATTSTCATEVSTEPITFCKKVVSASLSPPSSLLTASIKASSSQSEEAQKPRITEEMAREYGVTVLSSSNLPEACFEDSEDEEE